MKKIRYILEYIIVRMVLFYLGSLSMESASALGGWLARTIGSKLKAHKTAEKNISFALPHLSEEKKQQILHDMWDNLGRVVGEFPHIARMDHEAFLQHVKVKNPKIFEQLQSREKSAFFFSGHFGNWELLGKIAYEYGLPVTQVYRKANNPYVDALIQRIRNNYQHAGIPKGKSGAKTLLASIKRHEVFGMLVDQKMNDGIAVPFFGRDAMTAPAIANLALRNELPIIPAKIVRKNGTTSFTFTAYPALSLPTKGTHEEKIFKVMKEINKVLESWIKENPEQWFWVHNRWPKGL